MLQSTYCSLSWNIPPTLKMLELNAKPPPANTVLLSGFPNIVCAYLVGLLGNGICHSQNIFLFRTAHVQEKKR
jgi:hypothetical protein